MHQNHNVVCTSKVLEDKNPQSQITASIGDTVEKSDPSHTASGNGKLWRTPGKQRGNSSVVRYRITI